MLFLAALAAATLAQAPNEWTHQVPATAATYVARPSVTTRQVGIAPGTRPGTLRCVWSADIIVHRHTGDATTPREIASNAASRTLTGSRHGGCIENRRQIDRDIAARSPEINAHLVAVAAEDQDRAIRDAGR